LAWHTISEQTSWTNKTEPKLSRLRVSTRVPPESQGSSVPMSSVDQVMQVLAAQASGAGSARGALQPQVPHGSTAGAFVARGKRVRAPPAARGAPIVDDFDLISDEDSDDYYSIAPRIPPGRLERDKAREVEGSRGRWVEKRREKREERREKRRRR